MLLSLVENYRDMFIDHSLNLCSYLSLDHLNVSLPDIDFIGFWGLFQSNIECLPVHFQMITFQNYRLAVILMSWSAPGQEHLTVRSSHWPTSTNNRRGNIVQSFPLVTGRPQITPKCWRVSDARPTVAISVSVSQTRARHISMNVTHIWRLSHLLTLGLIKRVFSA